MAYASITARLLANSKRNRSTGCREWTGNTSNSGYGRLSVRCCGKVKKLFAHRVAYEAFHGPIPAGLEVDHKCVNPLCIEPKHIQAITKAENLALRGSGVRI